MKCKLTSIAKIMLSITLAGFISQSNATWYYASPAVYPSSQEFQCFCGPAIAQGWIYSLTGMWYGQYTLGAVSTNLCLGGTNAGELAGIMNLYAGSFSGYPRTFAYYSIPMFSQAEGFVINKIKNERKAVTVASSTVYIDGGIRTGGHWMNIFAIDVVWDSVRGKEIIQNVRVHDPLHGSAWQASYQALPLTFPLPRGDFIWASNNARAPGFLSRWQPIGGYWQLVTY